MHATSFNNLPKFNLSPDYQYVQSRFMDTKHTVEKLRRQAADKREELREERRRQDETRMPELKERDKRPKSKKRMGTFQESS